MILSPQDENTEAFETDGSASTSPTSLHHIILSFETKSGITEFAATLPSSSPPPKNVESLKDNIRKTMTTVDQGMSVEEIEPVIAERVANAIEAIAIYETKTNMARINELLPVMSMEVWDTTNVWTCTGKEKIMKTLAPRRLTSTPKEIPSCIT
ncbi:hypothetical protein Tco_1269518 [Tanacetum coccineum]